MVKKLIFIVFVIYGFTATAQIPKDKLTIDVSVFPEEKVELSINSQIFLAGELLQYKVYVTNALSHQGSLSAIAYVSLRDQQDSLVFNHKLKLLDGTANGDFFIPSNLKTGAYKLISYTNYSRNNEAAAFVQKDIYIINTFTKQEAFSKTGDTIFMNHIVEKSPHFSEENNPAKAKINLDKESYGFREKVSLKLENSLKGMKGRYVLSVRKINPIEISGKIPTAAKIYSEVFYVPELRGELISGLVLSKIDSMPVSNIEVALTVPGEDYIFKVAKTNSNGRFFFSVSEDYNSENSIVQLYGNEMEKNSYKVVLDKKELPIQKNKSYFLKLDEALKDWLLERSIQLQVENAYFDTKKDSILPSKTNPCFYEDLGTVFKLDDYTRFPSVRETFVEVITLAAIRGNGDDAKFIIHNEYDPDRIAKFNDIDPLVLMDGMLIPNNSELINYKARDIESIRIINTPYRYGTKIYSGIIAVETKKGDFVPNLSKSFVEMINLPPAVKQKKYYSPDYSNRNVISRIPDYRVQLLWEPSLSFKDTAYSTTFYTSDVPGLYEILLEGFNDRGIHISAKRYFKVLEP